MTVFLDSNVPMYAAGAEHRNKEPSLRFLRRAQDKSVSLVTSTEVLQEILHRYHRLGRPDVAAEVYHLVIDLCVAVLPVTLAETDLAVDLLNRHGGSVRDALHVAVMRHHDVTQVATFDAGFDAFAGVTRVELQ